MTNRTDLKKELDSFKSEMQGVNQSLDKFESLFEAEKVKIDNLRHSFATLAKIINHELIKSFDNSNQLVEHFLQKRD
jgi:hypothetical protein